MIYVEVNGHMYEAEVSGILGDIDWDRRDTKSIRAVMTYQQVVDNFKNNTPWYIHQTYEELERYDPERDEIITVPEDVFDNSEYCLAGEITDHRDGTCTIKMGKLTELEQVLAVL